MDGEEFIIPGKLLLEMQRLGPWTEMKTIAILAIYRAMMGGRITWYGVHTLHEDHCTAVYMSLASLWLSGFRQYPVDATTLN